MDLETSKLRIDKILKEKGISKSELARELNLDRASVSEMFKRPGEAPLKYMEAASKLTGVPVEWIRVGGTLSYSYDSELNEYLVKDPGVEYLNGKSIRPLTVTVDKHGNEVMTYVPVRAQAGYMKGYGDGGYLEKLPAFSLPILKSGTYRMFEVDGDSMLQLGGGGLHDGDIVIAQYVEDFFSIRDNRVYVVVSTEGIIVKRLLNRLREKENPVIVCNSDNKNGQHPAIILRPHQLLEVWELKAFLSKQLSFSTDLWEMLNNLQVQQALLEEKVKDMQTKP